jgi:hypothetical protein
VLFEKMVAAAPFFCVACSCTVLLRFAAAPFFYSLQLHRSFTLCSCTVLLQFAAAPFFCVCSCTVHMSATPLKAYHAFHLIVCLYNASQVSTLLLIDALNSWDNTEGLSLPRARRPPLCCGLLWPERRQFACYCGTMPRVLHWMRYGILLSLAANPV